MSDMKLSPRGAGRCRGTGEGRFPSRVLPLRTAVPDKFFPPNGSATSDYTGSPRPPTRREIHRPNRGRGKSREASGERKNGKRRAQEGTWKMLRTTTEGANRTGACSKAIPRMTAYMVMAARQ